MSIDGIVLVNKQKGLTSFQTIAVLRKNLGIKKIGHTGTLDKNATGLLVVCIGKATKLCKYLVAHSKRYIADIKFGIQTNTDDVNGETINEYKGDIDFEKIQEKLKYFTGEIKQIPPDYSSISIKGKRAYKLALEGKKPTIKERSVHIYDKRIFSFENNTLKIEISCSSGTYIRSIARDLGVATGYFAFLENLKRTLVGNFNIKDAFLAENINPNNIKVISPLDVLTDIPEIVVKEEYLINIKNGKKINSKWFIYDVPPQKDGIYKLSYNNELIAIIKLNNLNYTYDIVF